MFEETTGFLTMIFSLAATIAAIGPLLLALSMDRRANHRPQ